MSENYEVVTPSSIDDEEEDSNYDSPVERVKDAFGSRLEREWAIADDDHPLVKTAGTAEALRSSVPERVQQLLADDLYQDPDVFWREWLQNHEAACIREAKRIVKNVYGEDALYQEVEHTHDALDEPRIVRLPKQAEDILPMARDHGYDPVIEFEVDIETRTITTRDNGIGMTTGEAIEVWNEPVESTSGTDLSSAGNKGIGALTWNSVAEDDGGIFIKTRTRRNHTIHTDDLVPPHDREGYNFFSYLGGILPVPGGVEDSFYGTEFKIPVAEGYDLENTLSALSKYLELCPVKVRWVKKQGGQTVADEEFEPTTFFDQYIHAERDAPLAKIHRPGEFSLALDKPDVVSKGYSETDTWLLDMPIDRNDRHKHHLDTLFNDHLHIHNEQGLIVAGPNRGRLEQQVDELHEDDIPMPTPTADRDRLARGDAHSKFLDYLNDVAVAEEQQIASDLIQQFFGQADVETATKFISNNTEDFELALKFLNRHFKASLKNSESVLDTLIENHEFDIDGGGLYKRAVNKTSRSDRGKKPRGGPTSPPITEYDEHPLWDLVNLFADLQSSVSYATKGTSEPNKKGNRGSKELYNLLNNLDQQIYVAKQISADRAKVAWNTYPDAIIVRVDLYGKWLNEPFNAKKLKTVPFKESNNEDGEYDIPEHIDEAHSYSAIRTVDGDGEGLTGDPIRLRGDNGTTSVDARRTLDELTDTLEDADFGDRLIPAAPNRQTVRGKKAGQHRYIVVFPSTSSAENISDHYDWQKHAALARGTAAEMERLLEYPQVFKPEQFKSFIADQTIPVVDPFDDTHEHLKLSEAFGYDRKRMFLVKSHFTSVIRLLYGDWGPSWPNGTDERKRMARRNFLDHKLWSGYKNPLGGRYICPGCGDGFDSKQGRSHHLNYCEDGSKEDIDDDSEWRFCTLSERDAMNIHAYFDLVTDEDANDHISTVGKTKKSPLCEINYFLSVTKAAGFLPNSNRMEKAMWSDVWPRDSDVWQRYLRGTYLDEVGEEMYRMLRSKGVNPRDFVDRNKHPRAIGHILEREVGYDA